MTDFVVSGPRGSIACSRTGSGPPLILLAGLAATRRLWGEFPTHLAKYFSVVTMDNRGVGGSVSGRPFSLEGAAEDVFSVLDHLAEPTCRLLGASMGGLIAFRAALSAPERVERMVILSSAAQLTAHGRRSISLLRELLTHMPPEKFGRLLMTLAFAPPFQSRLPAFVDQTGDLFGLDPADLGGAIAQADAMLEGWDDREALRSLQIPALVCAGLRDPVVALEDTRELADCLADSEFVEVPEAGHSVLAEGGRRMLERIVTFLRSQGPTVEFR